jgi:photoactive yellow protein
LDTGQPSVIPFGLLELNGEGMVVHYCPARERGKQGSASEIIGKNFFDDVVPFPPVKEFKTRFLRFMAMGDLVQRFTIRFPFDEQDVRLQIMLAHITERTERGSERLALVRLMPENNMAYPQSAVA